MLAPHISCLLHISPVCRGKCAFLCIQPHRNKPNAKETPRCCWGRVSQQSLLGQLDDNRKHKPTFDWPLVGTAQRERTSGSRLLLSLSPVLQSKKSEPEDMYAYMFLVCLCLRERELKTGWLQQAQDKTHHVMGPLCATPLCLSLLILVFSSLSSGMSVPLSISSTCPLRLCPRLKKKKRSMMPPHTRKNTRGVRICILSRLPLTFLCN